MTRTIGGIIVIVAASTLALDAQWPIHQDPNAPRDADGSIRMDAPTPRTADGRPDLSGVWMRANSGPPRGGGPGGRAGRGGGRGAAGGPGRGANGANAAGDAANGDAADADADGGRGRGRGRRGGGGGIPLEPTTERFPFDPDGPPVATFFEAGGSMEGGLPYKEEALALKKERMAIQSKDNPDANCLPMGFLQFHQQPQPRKIIQTPDHIILENEANYGIRHIYMDGRDLPEQGSVLPWWFGYSVGRWDGDDLVVTTNNLRGAEHGPYDGWLDVNGSPYSGEAVFTERIRRPEYGHLQIDVTVDDSVYYTRPWTVRVDWRILPDQEMIEFICNENQLFRERVVID